MDVFVLPSRSEGFSNALLETMATGLPAVATRVGGNQEAIIDGVTGILVPPDDPDKLADGILRVLGDSNLARQLSAQGRKRVENYFSMDSMVRSFEQTYLSLL